MKKRIKSPDKNKWFDLELRKDRYIRIPRNFMEKIHLDSERNIVLKSNNNVWFFEIRDKNEENNIFEEVKVNVDKKNGFTVPLMHYELSYEPEVEDFMFFDDDNGIGCGDAAGYAVWADGKINKESNNAQGFKTMEEMDDFIREALNQIRKDNESNIH